MAVSASVVTVTTSATLLSTVPTDNQTGQSIAVQPAAGIFIGPSGVTTSTGFPVAAGSPFSMDLQPGEAIYGVCASGTVAVNVIQTGV